MADADFTVRLVNQVSAPAKAITNSMRDVSKAFGDTQRKLAAPLPKRTPMSDWDKGMAATKRSQAADFAAHQAKLVRLNELALKKQIKHSAQRDKVVAEHQKMMQGRMAQFHADHSAGMGLSNLADIGAPLAIKAVTAALLGTAAAVGYLAYKFVEAGLEAGKFAQSSTMAIGFLTDNALHAGVVFDDVRHLAQSLGLGVEKTVLSFQKLLAAQFTVGESKDLIKMVSDLQAIGASAEEAQGILLAMSQIKSKGRLQAQEMLQLQERGVSAELVYAALGKTLGKTRAEVMKLQTAGKIDGDMAIDAIKSAVMAKTNEKALGDVGKQRANTSLAGLQGQLGAGIENAWIDIGQAMLPGATRIAKLIAGTIGKIADDPKVAQLGDVLLAKWEKFTKWVEAKWPVIEGILIGGLHLTADAIIWVADALTMTDTKWDLLTGTVILFAAALGVAAIAGFFLMLPLLLLIGVVGLVIAGLAMLTSWIVDQGVKWYEGGRNMVGQLINGILSMLGPLGSTMAFVAAVALPGANPNAPKSGTMVPVPGMQQPFTTIRPDVPESAGLPPPNMNGVTAALAGVGDKTEGGKPSETHTVSIGEMPITVTAAPGDDPNATGEKVGAQIRAELAKLFKG